MTVYLSKTLENIKKYGPIPDLSGEPQKVEEYVYDEEEGYWLLENLVDAINARCDTLLDDGDYDFFDVEKCKVLVELIDELPKGSVPKKYEKMVSDLRSLALRAVSYNTGIGIEL